MTERNTDTSVVIIGAGQAGLSVGYYLRRLGLDPGNDFVLLDRGPGTGGAWQFRWESLRLGTAHRINDLPGMDELGLSFDNADRQLPAKDIVADYYRQYEQHYGLQVVRPADVTKVRATLDGFEVTFDDGDGDQTVTTQVIVNATGTWGSGFVPWYPGMNDFAGRHVHTVDYHDAEQFRDQKVVVVGGGTSAIGFVMELENVASELVWVARRPIEFLDEQELNIEAGAQSVALQDAAAREGRALPSIVSTTGVPRSRRIQAAIERGVLRARPMFRVDRAERGPLGGRHASRRRTSSSGRPASDPTSATSRRSSCASRRAGSPSGGGASFRNPRIFFAGYGPTGLHDRRQPRRPHGRPSGRGDAQHDGSGATLRDAATRLLRARIGAAPVPEERAQHASRRASG